MTLISGFSSIKEVSISSITTTFSGSYLFPKKVIVVAGCNKIVRNLQEAVERVKNMAAPANGARLESGTPCSRLGRCSACGGRMTAGCASERRMCCQYVVTGYQRTDRIHVVLVGEDLGY